MNKKKITKIISVLLVLILLISFSLETQANAVAVESWLIYSIITYATAVGFSFAVVGGVDAMYNTVKEKADEYNNIIDFYDIMRQNIKFVPNPNEPPSSEFLSLFFTAVGVEAMDNFLVWLTTDGGWLNGTDIFEQQNETFYYGWLNGTYQQIIIPSFEVLETHQVSGANYYYKLGLTNQPTLIPVSSANATTSQAGDYKFIQDVDESRIWTLYFNGGNLAYYRFNDGRYSTYYFDNLINVMEYFGYTSSDVAYILPFWTYSSAYESYNVMKSALYMNDGTIITGSNQVTNIIYPFVTSIESSADIVIPSEMPQIYPLLTPEEGFLMSNVELGSTDAIEWANKVEELFIETGTIPNPQPEIIQDPDFAPEPTPVPTPVPSPEIEDIEDLGLPTLGDAIFSKFPFSLPKDVGRIFTLLHAEPVTPYWQVDLTGNALGIPSNFEVDLGEYEVLGQITRWFSVVSYCLFLILITRGMIKW